MQKPTTNPMKARISEIEIFFACDEFCQIFERWLAEYHPEYFQKFTGQLCPSEIMTILISYHLSGYKNFEYYYQEFILVHHLADFPEAISYKRFLAYIPRIMDYIYFYLQLLLMNTSRLISLTALKYSLVTIYADTNIVFLRVWLRWEKQVPAGSMASKFT